MSRWCGHYLTPTHTSSHDPCRELHARPRKATIPSFVITPVTDAHPHQCFPAQLQCLILSLFPRLPACQLGQGPLRQGDTTTTACLVARPVRCICSPQQPQLPVTNLSHPFSAFLSVPLSAHVTVPRPQSQIPDTAANISRAWIISGEPFLEPCRSIHEDRHWGAQSLRVATLYPMGLSTAKVFSFRHWK